MPIKNKDGSFYQLSRPNPLMREQNFWDDSKVVLYNFKWKSIVVPSEIKEDVLIEPSYEEPANNIVPEVASCEDVVVSVSYQNKTEQNEDKVFKGQIRAYCLPAVVVEYNDRLYDQSYKTIHYNEKIIVDIKVISQKDINAVFYSKDDRITVGSILYPITMEKRWWKVIQVNELVLSGYEVLCEISDKQPSFH